MDTSISKGESKDLLKDEINIVSNNPIMSGLLHSISGLLAVLNASRQVMAVNDSFIKMLGIENPETSLGLRLGEIFQCVYEDTEESGCGTTKFCPTCGVAISIVLSLGQNRPVERMCSLTIKNGNNTKDIAFLVRSHPIELEKKKFILLFFQDITRQHQRAALERAFFHDINNLLSMLLSATELLVDDSPSEIADTIHQVSLRLLKEVSIQRSLLESDTHCYKAIWEEISVEKILDEISLFFSNHYASQRKRIDISKKSSNLTIKTDVSLLSRILHNMIINAFEATKEEHSVKVWVEHKGKNISFCVWNEAYIPEDISYRIFQRNFSTKNQAGRGIGTYSMKLFGEKILGGKVDFVTSEKEGTTFRFTISQKK